MSGPDCGAGCGATGLHSLADCLRRRGLDPKLAPRAGDIARLRARVAELEDLASTLEQQVSELRQIAGVR
jgi:hypothetical protein